LPSENRVGIDKLNREKEKQDFVIKPEKVVVPASVQLSPAAGTLPVKINADSTDTQALFDMDPQKLLQGIIYSEILGKPKSRRRGRW